MGGAAQRNYAVVPPDHDLPARGKSHPINFWYGSRRNFRDGSRRLRWNSFFWAAVLANAATCSSVCLLSFGRAIHSRMSFRRTRGLPSSRFLGPSYLALLDHRCASPAAPRMPAALYRTVRGPSRGRSAMVRFCVQCDRFGPFGYGVRLRAGLLGRWYCGEHRPEDMQARAEQGGSDGE